MRICDYCKEEVTQYQEPCVLEGGTVVHKACIERWQKEQEEFYTKLYKG